ncbi:MAG: gliding motility-associated C-terminal domain-containing protein [Bacteroidales bacterium]|nr:gliding motility-associated C-terminal domain-containing protein [Bacteroidales bacterium]
MGCTSTISQSIEILPTPVSPDTIYVVNGSPKYCYQSVDSLTLAVEGGSGASIQWFLESCGNNAPIIGMGNQIQVEAPKENTSFYARWMNSCGASDCIELQITVDSLPEMSVNGIFEICNNDSTMMTSANRTDCQYVWKDVETGVVLGNEPEIVLAPDFTTWYRQIATNENQCVDSIDFVINVSEPPALELGEDLYMFACDSVELNAGDGIGFEHYLWQDNSIESTYWVKESGVYYVTVYNDGCSITDSVYVELCTDKLFIPNAFSPNGDGLNDYFRPKLSDMTLKAEMYIYSRNGGLIFQTERITEGWDGKDLNGQECPNGTYAYLIKYHVKVGVGRTMEKTASGAVIIVK